MPKGYRVVEHPPESLIKYCTARSAEQILATRSLRWNAPHLFADPFELNYESELTFDPESLMQTAIKSVTAMIFAKEAPRGNSPLLTAMRRWRGEERFASPEEAAQVLKDLLGQMVDQRLNAIDQVMADWRHFARNLRICCFSAKPDIPSAWRLFADNHRGVAIRFQCGDDTSLPNPVKVEYRSTRPEITSLKEQLNAVIHSENVAPQESFSERYMTKAPFCREEREWRCFHNATNEASSNEAEDSVWFDDLPFEARELTSIYLGSCYPPEHRQRIVDWLKDNYSHTKLFQAKVATGKYDIEFERIAFK